MLAVSPFGNTRDELQGEVEESCFSIGADDFPDFGDTSLLESIDYDGLFVGINDGDVLPDLEMLAEFSVSGGEESEINTSSFEISVENADDSTKKDEEDKESGSGSGSNYSCSRGEEIVSEKDEGVVVKPAGKERDNKSKKSSAQSKNSHGKRKVKVDWTPELHRRFVQAVEQLGVDKAVPSRILELMGIECLTRHNIASHLQKYRSHRKHLLAREAEAASWSQRRQMYGAATGGGGVKRDVRAPWLPPTMGFPPMTPMHHFRPLHVWGHPTVDQSLVHMWPKHLPHSPSPPPHPTWPPAVPPPPPPPPPDSSYWHHHHHPHHRVPNALTQGTPCFTQPLGTTTRFASPPVAGIPPNAMYKVNNGIVNVTGQSGPPHPPFDFLPSKESVDAAIGDVLSMPWLPLPLGLKPPSLDSVMVELQRQGIPKVPPSCT